MNQAEIIIKRLKEASLSNTDSDLQKALSLNSSAIIPGWKKRNKNMSKECFEYAKKNPLISLDWLIFGTGNMLRDEALDPNKLPSKPIDWHLHHKIVLALMQMQKYNTLDKDTSKGGQHGRMRQLNATETATAIKKIYIHFEHEKTPKYTDLEKIIRLVV